MVLPLFKVLSLVIRVFSKPLISYTKQVHLKNEFGNSHPVLRKLFIRLGNRYHGWQTWVNRKFMKIQTQFAYKPLNDELAIEKGIEFFYQILFYSIVLGLPLYQMVQSSRQSKQKSMALQNKLKQIDEQIKKILQQKQKQNNGGPVYEHKQLQQVSTGNSQELQHRQSRDIGNKGRVMGGNYSLTNYGYTMHYSVPYFWRSMHHPLNSNIGNQHNNINSSSNDNVSSNSNNNSDNSMSVISNKKDDSTKDSNIIDIDNKVKDNAGKQDSKQAQV